MNKKRGAIQVADRDGKITTLEPPDYSPRRFAKAQQALVRLDKMRQQPTDGKRSSKFMAEYKEVWSETEPLWYWPAESWPRPKPGNRPSKVAIIGKAPNRIFAPWGEPSWELWGLNDTAVCPRHPEGCEGIPPIRAHTRWFQLHPPRYLRVHYPKGIDNLNALWKRRNGVRLYMDRHYKAYPSSEPFPKQKVEKMVPHGAYHASSFDWLLALAVLEGFKEIHLYGVALYTPPVMNGEPLSGRPCLEYWAGVAEGRGLKVIVHGTDGDLFKVIHVARLVSDLQYGWDREPGLDLTGRTNDPWKDLR